MPFFLVKLFPTFSGYSAKAHILDSQRAFLLKTVEEHESTFDPNHMRDFIDVYLSQESYTFCLKGQCRNFDQGVQR